MSVLDKMRSGSDSTFMQLMLGAVFVSFVAMYGGNPGSSTGSVVAVVNGTPITDVKFRREFSERQRMRRTLDDEQRAQLSEQVKRDLIEAELVEQAAHEMGIEVSDDEVARAVVYNPAFFGKDGAFDSAEYEAALARLSIARADYEEKLGRQLLREKTFAMVAAAVDVSDLEIREVWRRDATKIDITWVEVTPLRFQGEIDTSSEVVTRFIDENPERITAEYETSFDKLFNQPERVRLSMIRLPMTDADAATIEARADDLKRQVEGGASFAELAKKVSIDPSAANGGARPPMPLADLDPTTSEAVRALAPGQVAKVVGMTDVRLYQLDERIAAEVIPVEAVREDLAKKLLREDEAPKRAAAFAERVEAAWKEKGAPPQDVLDELGLFSRTSGPFAPSAGLRMDGAPPRDVVSELADAAIGAPMIKEVRSTYWIASLTERTEPDAAEFDTKKDTLRAEVLAMRRKSFLEAWTAELVAGATIERPATTN